MKFSIDRLTFCGNETFNTEQYLQDDIGVKRTGFAKYPYRDAFYMVDGSILQIAEKECVRSGKIKPLRYEFNPNNKIFEKVHFRNLKALKDAHCTRVDIALDVYDIDMSRWRWIDSKGRPQRHFKSGNGEFETTYIGGSHSDVIIRIYNKALEQKEKDSTWWRVEVQLRGETADLFMQGGNNFNPFRNITPVTDGHFPELEIKKRAMVNYLLEHPSGFSELSKTTRAEYKKILRAIASWETIDFYRVWQEKTSDVGSEVQAWYSFTNQNL